MDVARAIADPVRRRALERLRSGPLGAGALGAHETISQPSMSRHLRVLLDAGLVTHEPDPTDGRGRLYRLHVAPLQELDGWLAQFRHGWASALDALDTEVHRTVRDHRRHRPGTTEERSA